MRFAFYDRLSIRQKRAYDASDRIEKVPIPEAEQLTSLVQAIESGLKFEDTRATERACQALLDALTPRLKVPPLHMRVYAVRPRDHTGELHGLYEPNEDGAPPVVSVWMRTAQQKRVVAFRTFLRTVIHELCHHLDYELYRLPETFHTEGFYKRESHLMRQLAGDPPPRGGRKPAGEAANS